METSITESPDEYRTELERGITYNHEKLVHARKQPDNEELEAIFEHRVNVKLEAIFDMMVAETDGQA